MSRSNRPRRPHHSNGFITRFENPWPSAQRPTWGEVVELSSPLSWATANLHLHSHAREIKVVKPDWGKETLRAKSAGKHPSDFLVGTWLGHAGALVEIPLQEKDNESIYLVFDPIFSPRAGPTQWTGPSRLKASPCQVPDLPGCHAVFISHNHYDHLDLGTVMAILEAYPRAMWFVPLGNRQWMIDTGAKPDRVVEMDWWEDWEAKFRKGEFQPGSAEPSADSYDGVNAVRITCLPAQHNSGRSGIDQGQTLWCGWAVERFTWSKEADGPLQRRRKGAVYHAGDTGYRRTERSKVTCPIFEEIGEKFGSFDLSFVPIWRGGSLGFVSYLGLRLSHHDVPSALHCSPKDAMAIHKDVKSRNTVGVHFGTFIGAENESYEAMIEFNEARDKLGVHPLNETDDGSGRAGTLDIGGDIVVEIKEI